MRLLLYVQHLLGIGHVRRAARLAKEFAAAGLEVTAVCGGLPVPGADFGSAQLAFLPAARATDATFGTLVDEGGKPLDANWHARRQAALRELVVSQRPQILLFESFPFGRLAFRSELLPLLQEARQAWPLLVVSSVRDVLVESKLERATEMAALARQYIDLILVHGDPQFLALEDSFPLAAQLADRIVYTGYVAPPPQTLAIPSTEEVVVSVGGGAVGTALLRTALRARSLSRFAQAPWRLCCGPAFPTEELRALQRAAPAGVIVERMRPDFDRLLAACQLSISQAGYNTVLDVLVAGCRAVLVPISAPGQTEQALRAARLAARSRVVCLPESLLDPQTLAAALTEASSLPLPGLKLRMEGAQTSVQAVLAAARERGLAAPQESSLPRAAPVSVLLPKASALFSALAGALDARFRAGRPLRFFWRDDDAKELTPALSRLLRLRARWQAPIALAVIPARATAALGAELRQAGPAVRVIQHGYAHVNHAPAGQKKTELDENRLQAEVLAELQAGWQRLIELVGEQALRVLVPPWNRIGPRLLDKVRAAGYLAVSGYRSGGPCDTHCDLIDWRGSRSFIGAAAVLENCLERLAMAEQESGYWGLLTHHLVMDEATWSFLNDFLAFATGHPGALFCKPEELLPASSAESVSRY